MSNHEIVCEFDEPEMPLKKPPCLQLADKAVRSTKITI